MKYHTLFFRKLEKMSQSLSSAAVVIGALWVKATVPYELRTYQVNSFIHVNIDLSENFVWAESEQH